MCWSFTRTSEESAQSQALGWTSRIPPSTQEAGPPITLLPRLPPAR